MLHKAGLEVVEAPVEEEVVVVVVMEVTEVVVVEEVVVAMEEQVVAVEGKVVTVITGEALMEVVLLVAAGRVQHVQYRSSTFPTMDLKRVCV